MNTSALSFFIGFFLCLQSCQAKAFTYQESSSPLAIRDIAEYMVDRSGEWSFEDAARETFANFKPIGGQDLNYGFTSFTFWIRFKISEIPAQASPLVILPRYALIDELALFIPNQHGGYDRKLTGRNFPANQREIKNRSPGFLIEPKPYMNDRYFYIRARTESASQFPFTIMSLLDYANRDHDEQFVRALYIGAILIMAIYNLILFFMTKQVKYAFYVIFVLSSCLLCMAIYGYTFEYLWPNAITFNKISIHLIISTAVLSVSMFFITSLRELRKNLFLLRVTLGICAWAVITALQGMILPYGLAIKFTLLCVSFSATYLIAVSIFLTLKGSRTAFFYLMSFVALFGGTVFYILNLMGLLPGHLLLELAPQIGSALQVTLLTFALADQFRIIKNQKQAALAKLLHFQKDHIRLLDQKVEEKTRDIKSILSSIPQGIFTISDEELSIDPEHSSYLSTLLETEQLANKSSIELLFKESELKSEKLYQIEAVLKSSLNELDFNFHANSALLVHEYTVLKQGQNRIFQIDWHPVVDSSQHVRKILVALRDVTNIKQLERQSQEQSKELQMIKEILGNPPEKLQTFYSKAKQYLDLSFKNLFSESQQESLQQIFIMMHTLKGEARALSLTMLSQNIHEVESQIIEAQNNSKHSIDKLKSSLMILQKLISDFEKVEAEKLGRTLGSGTKFVSKNRLQQILNCVQNIPESDIQETSRSQFLAARNMMYETCFDSIKSVADDLSLALEETAKYVGKDVPELIFTHNDLTFIKSSTRDALCNSLIHIVRNSLDHGIEYPQLRLQLGKPPHGRIQIETRLTNDCLILTYHDDGGGLNLDRILQRAISKGLVKESTPPLTEQEIARLIFSPGFSTSDKLSEISGRGVGMSAAKCFIEEIDGSLEIELGDCQNHESVPFRIVIRIPLTALENAG